MIWNELGYIPFIIDPCCLGSYHLISIWQYFGAPRTLQALAADRLVPHRLGQIDPKTGNQPLDFMYRAQWRSVPSS